jgi:hypothetical protein
MKAVLASMGLVLLLAGAAFSQPVNPTNDPFKPGYVNTGKRFGYCANFARANNCRPRWDRHDHSCVCINRR